MADVRNTNPFLDDDDNIETNSVEDAADEQHGNKPNDSHEISLDLLAAKLLKENFVLTALEFHTELLETGREIPRLRDYFSNPGNFERTRDDNISSTLPRTSSIQTFDSLDFARYSDDGGGQVDERVAVLEFELRKAQDTIKSLRASLTKEAETNGSNENINEGVITIGQEDSIKPLEKRAINFLLNEYLMLHNYKLTAVTFSEENEDQDFEDWDDVGLNIPRPPGLLHLYKDYGSHVVLSSETNDCSCQADIEDDSVLRLSDEWADLKSHLESRIMELEEQNRICRNENQNLNSLVKDLQKQRSENQIVYNSAPTHRNSTCLDQEIDYTTNAETCCMTMGIPEQTSDPISNSCVPSENSEAVCDNVNSVMDNECDRLQNMDVTDCSNCVVKETIVTNGEHNLHIHGNEAKNVQRNINGETSSRQLSSSFQRALLDVCFHVSKDNRIVQEVSQIVTADRDHIVMMLSRCLPHIVPNVLLAKREELIPLILCTAMLHPEPKERDKLLNVLFNLIKKPDEEQRQMILTGCVAYAQHTGSARLIEELLPQCWEQINHKYPERRMLVAEACGTLASYIPHEILSSLILSMLQQMLADDKDSEVREAVVRSLGILFGFICDTDKYSQGAELLWISLKDSSERVVSTALQIFLPSLAMWADELDKLEHNLVHSIVRDLEELVKSAQAAQKASNSTHIPLNESRFMNSVSALQQLICFLYVSVIKSGPYCDKLNQVLHTVVDVDISRFPKRSSLLTDLKVICGDKDHLSALVHLFEQHVSQEWFEPWDSFNWVVNNLIPRLLEVVMGAGLALPKIVSCLCRCFFCLSRTFGKVFVEKRIRPKFIELLVLTDEHTDHRGYAAAKQMTVTTCIVPVYAAGVLSAFNMEEDRQQLSQFLQEILCTLSIYQAPLESLKTAFIELSYTPSNHELLLGVLWDGVVHTSAQVRATSARLFELMVKGVGENLISTKVFPALVTLGSDPEIIVRTATIPALGAIIENVSLVDMLDRVYMQFITFMDDPIYRDEHEVNLELIRTLARVGPNAEPRFRDDLILPRLAFVALNNNHQQNEQKKTEVALQLFETYSALSCCFINDQLIQEAMLPGLRCLKQDVAVIAPEHEEVISSIIKDYENKLQISRSGSFSGSQSNSEDMKSRVMNRIKDTTAKANLSNIFTRKK